MAVKSVAEKAAEMKSTMLAKRLVQTDPEYRQAAYECGVEAARLALKVKLAVLTDTVKATVQSKLATALAMDALSEYDREILAGKGKAKAAETTSTVVAPTKSKASSAKATVA
jgi:hypothetical protein